MLQGLKCQEKSSHHKLWKITRQCALEECDSTVRRLLEEDSKLGRTAIMKTKEMVQIKVGYTRETVDHQKGFCMKICILGHYLKTAEREVCEIIYPLIDPISLEKSRETNVT